MSKQQEEQQKDRISIVVARSKPPTAMQHATRWLTIATYYVGQHVRSWRSWVGLAFELGPLAVVLVALFKFSLKWGAYATVALVIRYVYRAWRDGRRSAEPVERNATARSVEETMLLVEALRGPLPDKAAIDRFQVQILKLVASFVRDHRCDRLRPTIFANLVVEDGNDLVVIARDSDHREHRARYPKADMLVWAAMTENRARWTGDLYKEFPDTRPGRPYKSILVIPIRHEHRVVGAVSIDSSSKYHFDRHAEEYIAHLAPYLALLSWTLVQLDAKVQAAQ